MTNLDVSFHAPFLFFVFYINIVKEIKLDSPAIIYDQNNPIFIKMWVFYALKVFDRKFFNSLMPV